MDLLGVTIVTGDQWVKEETAHTLRALEIAGRTDVPVVSGAETSLVNSKESSEIWESEFGALNFKGAWTPPVVSRARCDPRSCRKERPHYKTAERTYAVDFIIRTGPQVSR